MSRFEITPYDARSGMSARVTEQVSSLFKSNYPPSHSEDDRVNDIADMLSGRAVTNAFLEGGTFYVASSNDASFAGFAESKTVDTANGTHEMLKWIMTAAEYRGHRLATLLHKSFIVDATLRAIERDPKPTLALLNVHEQNPARAIYEHWGYRVVEKTDKNKLLMTMELPKDN